MIKKKQVLLMAIMTMVLAIIALISSYFLAISIIEVSREASNAVLLLDPNYSKADELHDSMYDRLNIFSRIMSGLAVMLGPVAGFLFKIYLSESKETVNKE